VAQLATLGIMASKIFICVVGVLALFLCFYSLQDVPRNHEIRNPTPTLTVLWFVIAVVVLASVVAVVRTSKPAKIISLLASGFGIFISLFLSCI